VTSNGNSIEVPPGNTDLEVSIFGPGFGECVVVHFGNGDWGIVDSCLDPKSKRSAALGYLEALHIDVSNSVRFVAATHWHDDHINGISDLFIAATSAFFVCTGAVGNPDFKDILASWTGCQNLPGGSGVDELRSVMGEIKKRQSNSRFPAPKLAFSGKILWERNVSPPVIVRALSPSDSTTISSITQLIGINPHNAQMRRRVPNIRPNNTSVVLAIRVGLHSILLGADLEEQGEASLGWSAIVNEFDPTGDKHQGFKVPHHGSSNGHHDGIWRNMLINRAWAVTTPFVNGNVRLPSEADCQRILKYTSESYITAPPRPAKYKDSNKTVEKMVKSRASSVHLIPGRYGHVRLRKGISEAADSPWRVELFGDATSVKDFIERGFI